jgi:hypothetical protein
MTTPTQYALSRWRYASDICLGTTLLWFLLRYLGDTNPVWAIISFIVVTDPTIEKAHPNFLSRINNTIVGCIAGIAFVMLFGSPEWLLPICLTATALIASLLVKGSSNWKLATATAALIVSSAIVDHSSLTALSKPFDEQPRSRAAVLRQCSFPGFSPPLAKGTIPRPRGILNGDFRNDRYRPRAPEPAQDDYRAGVIRS